MREKNPAHMNISNLRLLNKRGEIRIPEVQRDLVWTKSQKQLLIDSLLKDYDIPKIYFRVIEENDKKIYDVIDGQQRLNTIFSFVNNEFELSADSDDIDGEVVAGKKYEELSSDLQILFDGVTLDIVKLTDYTDEEIDETFLRLQNGTPLKAAEKRRAIAGNMRRVVHGLSENKLFDLYCGFEDTHYAYEDVTAKILKQIKEGLGSVSAQALHKFFEDYPAIKSTDSECKKVKSSLNFLKKAFSSTPNPKLKKYATLDLAIIANNMLNNYDLNNYPNEFATTYLEFCDMRVKNSELEEDKQDQKLISYGNTTRGDSIEYIKYRQNYLLDYFIECMPYLVVKDEQRFFTQEQRDVIYRRDKGICAICGKHLTEDDEYHADHIKPWSKGGETKLENGQLLCAKCNKSKGDKE